MFHVEHGAPGAPPMFYVEHITPIRYCDLYGR